MAETPSCATCPYFDRARLNGGPRGYCRIRPPVTFQSRTVWPIVDQEDWCGEHPDRQPPTRNA